MVHLYMHLAKPILHSMLVDYIITSHNPKGQHYLGSTQEMATKQGETGKSKTEQNICLVDMEKLMADNS